MYAHQQIIDAYLDYVLPVPHAIIVRRYQPNKFTNIWFSTYLWGVIFLRNQRMPLFDGTKISLFHVHVGR